LAYCWRSDLRPGNVVNEMYEGFLTNETMTTHMWCPFRARRYSHFVQHFSTAYRSQHTSCIGHFVTPVTPVTLPQSPPCPWHSQPIDAECCILSSPHMIQIRYTLSCSLPRMIVCHRTGIDIVVVTFIFTKVFISI
jgi:hypothetical protein